MANMTQAEITFHVQVTIDFILNTIQQPQYLHPCRGLQTHAHAHNVEPLWFPSLHVNNRAAAVPEDQQCVFSVHEVLIADYMNNGGISVQIIRRASQSTKLLIKCGAPPRGSMTFNFSLFHHKHAYTELGKKKKK